MKLYQVRHRKTGKWAKAGCHEGDWVDKQAVGAFWKDVKAHLRAVCVASGYYGMKTTKDAEENWEAIEYDVRPTGKIIPMAEISSISVHRKTGSHPSQTKCLDLPSIELKLCGTGILRDFGNDPIPWSIQAEYDDDTSARTIVYVDGNRVADITVHCSPAVSLSDEVQAISSALVWSAIRARIQRASGWHPHGSSDQE